VDMLSKRSSQRCQTSFCCRVGKATAVATVPDQAIAIWLLWLSPWLLMEVLL